MWFILDDKNNVSRNGVWRLVSLSREGDLGPFFPASLNLNSEDFVLRAHGPAVGVQPFPRDFHPLCTTVEYLLQGDPQFMNDGRVLLPSLLPSQAAVAVPGEAVQVKAGERAKRIVSIHLHVLVISPVGFTTKEHLKGVGATKERGKGRVRIPMEGVGESVSWTFSGGSISSLQA